MIKRINSDYSIDNVIKFCKAARDLKIPASINLDYLDWEVKPHTLLHALFVERRYDEYQSGLFILDEDGDITATAGMNAFDLDGRMYCQSRSFNIKRSHDYHSLSFMISDYAFLRGYEGGVITFEPHNKEFADKLVRIQQQHTEDPHYTKHISLEKIKSHTYKKKRTRCLPLTMYDKLVVHRYCKQHIAYHLFNEDYETEFLEKLKPFAVKD